MSTTAALLRQFYGLDADGSVPDPTDINSSSFQPEPFFQQLVNTNDLKELTRQQQKLQSELISLDNDLQNLVYDNYTKFIKASETVRSMKEGLVDLTSQMKQLLASLGTVSEEAGIIRNDLKENRDKISRLVGISRLFERIDFISRLPIKLQAHVDIGNYEAAVDMWLSAEKVLETQNHFESFVKIREDCKKIIEEIKVRVRAKMLLEDTRTDDSITCAATLIKLNMPADTILPALTAQRTKLTLLKVDQIKPDSDPFISLNMIQEQIIDDCKLFINGYRRSLLKFSKLLDNSADREEPMDKTLHDYRQELFKKLNKTISLDSVCSLECSRFSEFLDKFSSTIGIVGLYQQRQSFMQWILQKFIQSRFDKLSSSSLDTITKDPSLDVDVAFNNVIKQFKDDVGQLIIDFEVLVKTLPDSKYHLIQGTSKLFDKLLSSFQTIDPRFSLLTFSISHHFGIRMIPYVFELISRFDKDSPLLNMESTLKDDAAHTAKKCLANFIDNKRKMLTEIIAQGMLTTNWLEARTPSDVSISTCLVLQELSQVWSQLDIIMTKITDGDENSSQSSRSSRTKRSGFSGAPNSSQTPLFHGLRDDNLHQIDRYFNAVNRLHLAQAPDFNTTSILTSIAMYVMKTLLEYVRNDTFSCAGFNQMQVDAYFIYMTLFDKLSEQRQNLFIALIEEILSSAADRTVEPIPFKMIVLSEIYTRSDSNNKPTSATPVV